MGNQNFSPVTPHFTNLEKTENTIIYPKLPPLDQGSCYVYAILPSEQFCEVILDQQKEETVQTAKNSSENDHLEYFLSAILLVFYEVGFLAGFQSKGISDNFNSQLLKDNERNFLRVKARISNLTDTSTGSSGRFEENPPILYFDTPQNKNNNLDLQNIRVSLRHAKGDLQAEHLIENLKKQASEQIVPKRSPLVRNSFVA